MFARHTALRRHRLVLAATLVWMASAAAVAHADIPTRIVHTDAGDVQGLSTSGVARYLGIPYAAPPVGDLRWRPPRTPAAWSQVLQATKPGANCPQPQRGVFARPSTTEDCLYLNVFAPSSGRASTRRPVMVWLHGGGLFSGEADDYDGSKLARRGKVVVVTINYRVAALGFLSQPAINDEGHAFANYGIMDQQFALQWVRRNIARFGGDPANVTIFGQSGGGTAVMANLQSPLSKGLFHRAIVESGTRIALTTPEAALKAGQEFAADAGCADQSAACLRGLSVEQILAHQAPILHYVTEFPSVDGTVITASADTAFRTGNFNRVPVLTGLVRDEQAFFLPELNTGKPHTDDDYKRYAGLFGAAHADMLLAKYPVARYGSPSLAEIAMAEGAKACTARRLDRSWSSYVPVYAYRFDDRTAPSYFRAVSYPMGAYHTSELLYLFPNFHGGQGTPQALNPAQERLSDLLVDYWTNFARTGNPSPRGGKVPAWPRYSPAQDNVQSLGLPGAKPLAGYGRANDCAMWDGVLTFR